MTQTGVQYLEVSEEYAGQRLDNFLLRQLKGVPRSKIYRMIRKGEVRVNGKRPKPTHRLETLDKIRVPPLRLGDEPVKPNLSVAKNVENTILYEDKVILIINKPTGLAVHGGSGVTNGVIESFRAVRPDAPYLELVHRLDRETSGCLMIAKRRSVLKRLQAELHHKNTLLKQYCVIVHGQWPANRTQVDLPIAKNTLSSGERVSRVQSDGKESLTRFRLLAAGTQSLLEAIPVTGRTHQIRVHCHHAGHPVVGDDKYGAEDRDKRLRPGRMMLHASRLVIPAGLDLPEIDVSAPMDEKMQALWDRLVRDNSPG